MSGLLLIQIAGVAATFASASLFYYASLDPSWNLQTYEGGPIQKRRGSQIANGPSECNPLCGSCPHMSACRSCVDCKLRSVQSRPRHLLGSMLLTRPPQPAFGASGRPKGACHVRPPFEALSPGSGPRGLGAHPPGGRCLQRVCHDLNYRSQSVERLLAQRAAGAEDPDALGVTCQFMPDNGLSARMHKLHCDLLLASGAIALERLLPCRDGPGQLVRVLLRDVLHVRKCRAAASWPCERPPVAPRALPG